MDSTLVRLHVEWPALAPCFRNEIEHGAFLEKGHQDGSYFVSSCILPRMAEGPRDISGREENSVRERCGFLPYLGCLL